MGFSCLAFRLFIIIRLWYTNVRRRQLLTLNLFSVLVQIYSVFSGNWWLVTNFLIAEFSLGALPSAVRPGSNQVPTMPCQYSRTIMLTLTLITCTVSLAQTLISTTYHVVYIPNHNTAASDPQAKNYHTVFYVSTPLSRGRNLDASLSNEHPHVVSLLGILTAHRMPVELTFTAVTGAELRA